MTDEEIDRIESLVRMLDAYSHEGAFRASSEFSTLTDDECIRLQPMETQDDLSEMERRIDRDVCKTKGVADEGKINLLAKLTGLDIRLVGSPCDPENFAIRVPVADGLLEFQIS
jgi:hypothetical protein